MTEAAHLDRPTIWMGHAGPISVPDLTEGVAFYETLGLHPIHHYDDFAALQLRGGTHLVLLAEDVDATGERAPFDLMVEDIDGFRAQLVAAGLQPSAIERSGAHQLFHVCDPSGRSVMVLDSHVVGVA